MQFKLALKYTVSLKVINMLFSFVVNLLMVRLLGLETSGQFFFAIAVLSLIILVLGLSLESAIVYYATSNNGNISPLWRHTLGLLLIQAIASYAILSLLSLPVNNTLGCVYIMANIGIAYMDAFFSAQKKFIALNSILLSANIAGAIILFSFYLSPGNNTAVKGETVYVGIPALQAVSLLLYFALQKKERPYEQATASLLKNVYRYAMIALISNVLFFLVTRVDYYFVKRFCDPDLLSNYIQVSRLGQLLVVVPAFTAPLVFRYSTGTQGSFSVEKLQAICRMVSLFFLFVIIGVAACGQWLFPWVFGKGFDYMYNSMLVYLPGFWALSIITLLASYLAGKKKLRHNLLVSGLALAVIVTGDLILIPAFGITGAAAASSIAYCAGMIYLLMVFQREQGVQWKDFFLYRKSDFDYFK